MKTRILSIICVLASATLSFASTIEFECSQGTSSDIEITINSDRPYKKAIIFKSMPINEPLYIMKDSGPKFSDSPQFAPTDYVDSLQFRLFPNKKFTKFQIIGSTESNRFIDLKKNIAPGSNYYKVKLQYKDDTFSELTEAKIGYREIDSLEFLSLVRETISYSHWRMFNIQSKGLGPAKKELDIKGGIQGSINYEGFVNVFGGSYGSDIFMKDYQEIDIIINGQHFARTNAKGCSPAKSNSGKINTGLTGQLIITGIYEGKVDFHIETVDRCAGGGYFEVTMPDGKISQYPWDYEREDVESYLKKYSKNILSNKWKVEFDRDNWAEAELIKN